MKRQIMKSLSAFCTSVMMLVAASSLVVSCYDDSALWDELENVQGELDGIDQRLKNLETLKSQLETLTARVDALYTLKFQVSDSNELQYSFDNGKTWNGTSIILAAECNCEPCNHECPPCQYVPCDHECPEVSLVDNGDSVTIKVGDAEFTIVKPQEIAFELRAGKLYFESEATLTVAVKASGIEDVTVISAPKGWWAEINSEGKVEITAPDYESTQPELDYDTWEEIPAENAASGYVKVHACAEGKCMVGKIPVEVVARALSVKAFGGKAYFNVAGATSYAPTFYYGIATKETLEEETAVIIKALNDDDWYVYEEYENQNWGDASVEVAIADLLGEEPVDGTEYVVWALLHDYSKMSYSTEDLVLAYYQNVNVSITEVEAEKTAYNVTVNVEVDGAESYVAVAMPQQYVDDVEYQKEQMVMALSEGQYYGKLYTENYSGSALDIAAGTTFSMTGLYSPAATLYVFILPLDGRAAEDYTAADVAYAEFTTAELTSGGSIDVTVTQVTEYMGKEYSYEIWDYVDALIKLDPYTELGVKVELSAEPDFSAFYFSWLDEATYADYGAYEEDLVDYLLENSYGMNPAEIDGWPLHITEKVSPAETRHFVAFVVDKAGKYGKIAHVELTSEELVKADFEWIEPYTSNVVDGILKNTTTLKFTPVFEGGVEAASYKYVLTQTRYYNQYEGKDDAQMAEELFFSTSSSVKTVTADDLNNGVLYVEDHSYGYPYYFAIVPIDAEGKPGASAAILEYETVFQLDEVTTEGTEFEATKPEIKVGLPEDSEFYPDGGWGDGAYYGYEDQTEWGYGYHYYYEINFEVTPVEGTEVAAVLCDTQSYPLGADAATRAGQLWSESLGYGTMITSVPEASSYKYLSHYNDEPAPAVVLVVSWKDAEGNTYYMDMDLQDDLQYYADKMTAMINGGGSEEPAELSVVGKQWAFNWTDYAMMMGMENMSACLDFGVSVEGYFMAGIDYEAIYGSEAAGMWMAGVEGYFELVETDATSGEIRILTADWETGDLAYSGTSILYSDLTETTCTFNGTGQFEELFVNVQATVMDEHVTVQSQGIGGW